MSHETLEEAVHSYRPGSSASGLRACGWMTVHLEDQTQGFQIVQKTSWKCKCNFLQNLTIEAEPEEIWLELKRKDRYCAKGERALRRLLCRHGLSMKVAFKTILRLFYGRNLGLENSAPASCALLALLFPLATES